MIDSLGTVRGYATTFGTISSPIGGDEGEESFRLRQRAFGALCNVVPCTVMHEPGVAIATTWDKSLRIWQDSHGVAVEFGVPCTAEGRGTRAAIASGFCDMSIAFDVLESTISFSDGLPITEVALAGLDHVTICDEGAFQGACCWLSDMPADRMPPRIKSASLHWRLGVIARDQKRAEDRALAARVLAAKAAPAPRGPRGKAEPILIQASNHSNFCAGLARATNGRFRKDSRRVRPLFV
jgi:phage head maturation protease